MKKYKQITITKISDHGGTEKTPTHAIVCRDEAGGKVTVGKLWTKTSDHGKFLSGLMSDDYTNSEGKTYDGYCIVSLKDLKALEDEITELSRKPVESTKTSKSEDYPDGIDTSDMPF